MIASYVFSETTPASAISAASSQPVAGAASWAPNGVAGGMLDDFDSLDILASLVGATGGVLDVYVQYSPDQGVNWADLVHFTQLGAGAAAIKYRASISLFTNAVAPVVVGTNASPALAAGAEVQGPWGDRLRLFFVAGSGTSQGAAVKVWVTGQRSRLREHGERG